MFSAQGVYEIQYITSKNMNILQKDLNIMNEQNRQNTLILTQIVFNK